MEPHDPPEAPAELGLERLRLRYPGTCRLCGRTLEKGVEALYERASRTLQCVDCNAIDSTPVLELGSAGDSAHREYERRRAAREVRVKARLGNTIGRVALALAGDPQSTRAWERGSTGEQKLAKALAGLEDLVVLHDRRVPGTRGNIDHILISPAGVFVVDAKRYEGLIQIRDRGGLFNRDERLYVGSRDCSDLALNMGWQTSAVREALATARTDLSSIPIMPVLCFVDGEWPLLLPPESYKGVRLEGTRSIKKLIGEPRILDPEQIDQISRLLAVALPSK